MDFLKRYLIDISRFFLTIYLLVLNWSNLVLYPKLLQELLETFIYEMMTVVNDNRLRKVMLTNDLPEEFLYLLSLYVFQRFDLYLFSEIVNDCYQEFDLSLSEGE